MKKSICLLCSFLFVTLLSAQVKLSGTYVIKSKEYIIGPKYANALPKQITISQSPDSLFLESVSIGSDGKDVTSRQGIALNGAFATSISSSSNRKLVRSLGWSADKKTVTITTVFYVPESETEIDFTRVDKLNLSENGRQLNFHKKSIETKSETWEVNGVFQKQE